MPITVRIIPTVLTSHKSVLGPVTFKMIACEEWAKPQILKSKCPAQGKPEIPSSYPSKRRLISFGAGESQPKQT